MDHFLTPLHGRSVRHRKRNASVFDLDLQKGLIILLILSSVLSELISLPIRILYRCNDMPHDWEIGHCLLTEVCLMRSCTRSLALIERIVHCSAFLENILKNGPTLENQHVLG